MVVTLGGDGTAGEVAAVLAGGAVAMAPLPGGNANVYARAGGWPASLHQALPVLGAALAGGWRGETTLGRVVLDGDEGRTFLTNAGVGIDAATVEWVEARPRVKRRARHVGFALAAVVAAGGAIRGPRLRVSHDGDPAVDAITALVACGEPVHVPRPPRARPGPGGGRPRTARLVRTDTRPPDRARRPHGQALAGGTPDVGRAPLHGGPLTGELLVSADRPAPVQADGEPLGRHREARFTAGDHADGGRSARWRGPQVGRPPTDLTDEGHERPDDRSSSKEARR